MVWFVSCPEGGRSSFDLEEIKEIYEVREALEVTAVRLAVRADTKHLDKLKDVLEETRATLERDELVAYPLDLDFHQEISSLTRRTGSSPELSPRSTLNCNWPGSSRRPSRVAPEKHTRNTSPYSRL